MYGWSLKFTRLCLFGRVCLISLLYCCLWSHENKSIISQNCLPQIPILPCSSAKLFFFSQQVKAITRGSNASPSGTLYILLLACLYRLPLEWAVYLTIKTKFKFARSWSQELICNSPFQLLYVLYSSLWVSSENLGLFQDSTP